jgi:hypothetical protein
MRSKGKLRRLSAESRVHRISLPVFRGGRECPAAGDLKNENTPGEGTNEK